jgi:hypothetical protein
MKKPALILNLLWASIAAGTFYAGVIWRGDRPAATSTTASGVRIASAPEPVKLAGSGQSSMVKAGAVSRDDDVLDFFKRYGHRQCTTPLSAEVMTQAVTEALRETNPIKSQMLFARLMEELTPENAESALDHAQGKHEWLDSMRYMGMLTYAWAGSIRRRQWNRLARRTTARLAWDRPVRSLAGRPRIRRGPSPGSTAYEGDNKGWMAQSLISGLAKSDFDGAMKYASRSRMTWTNAGPPKPWRAK